MESYYVIRIAPDGSETSIGPFGLAYAEAVLDYVRDYADAHGHKDDELHIINAGVCDV